MKFYGKLPCPLEKELEFAFSWFLELITQHSRSNTQDWSSEAGHPKLGQIGHFLNDLLLFGGLKLETSGQRNCSRAKTGQHLFHQFSSTFNVQGFSLCFQTLWEEPGMGQLSSEVWLFWGYSLGASCTSAALDYESFGHWISPVLFRKGLEGNLNTRRKVQVWIWQLEIVCAVLCPRTEQGVTLKLKAKTVCSVGYLTIRILQTGESQDSFDSPATIVGQKSKHFQGNVSNSKTVQVLREWIPAPSCERSSQDKSTIFSAYTSSCTRCFCWHSSAFRGSYHSPDWHNCARRVSGRVLTCKHPGSAAGLRLSWE